jgi:hypothetical protein
MQSMQIELSFFFLLYFILIDRFNLDFLGTWSVESVWDLNFKLGIDEVWFLTLIIIKKLDTLLENKCANKIIQKLSAPSAMKN